MRVAIHARFDRAKVKTLKTSYGNCDLGAPRLAHTIVHEYVDHKSAREGAAVTPDKQHGNQVGVMSNLVKVVCQQRQSVGRGRKMRAATVNLHIVLSIST